MNSHSFRDRITPEMAERLYELLKTCSNTTDGAYVMIDGHGDKAITDEIHLILRGFDTTAHREKE
jgi:hypothetical protein